MRNRHAQTILPASFVRLSVEVTFEALETPDNDFLELAWAAHGNPNALWWSCCMA